jgi:hypothetical protein
MPHHKLPVRLGWLVLDWLAAAGAEPASQPAAGSTQPATTSKFTATSNCLNNRCHSFFKIWRQHQHPLKKMAPTSSCQHPARPSQYKKKGANSNQHSQNGANPQQYLATSYHSYHQREITPYLSYIAVHQA